MQRKKLARALNWLFGTPVISGALWIILTFLADMLDGSRESHPALTLGGMLTLPVILVATIAGVIIALWSLSWD